MIIKHADDKAKRLALLAELKKSALLDARQREWLDEELVRVRRGIEGERDAAFYIDSYLKASKNNAVIHDLRLEFEGEVAQIDHLFFNRRLDFFLVETKCFNGNLAINEHGEFSVTYTNGRTSASRHRSSKASATNASSQSCSSAWRSQAAWA